MSLVDIDFTEYLPAHKQRSVRRNAPLCAWPDTAGENAGINGSAVLQAAYKWELVRS